MEPIGDALKRVVNAPEFAARYDDLRVEVYGESWCSKVFV